MTIKKMIWCDECGAEFKNETEVKVHEELNCVPWSEGDRVLFRYGILSFPGKVTRLGELVDKPGEVRVVYVEADEKVEEPEEQWHTGRHFFVPITALRAEPTKGERVA